MNEQDLRWHTDLISNATQDARVKMQLADDRMGAALDALAVAQNDIPAMVTQARLVEMSDTPSQYMSHAQSYGQDIDRQMRKARDLTGEAGDRLREGIEAITAAKESLEALETATPEPSVTSREQQAWPEGVPTLSDLRQRIELFEESLTAATESAEDIGHQIEQSREGLTKLGNASYRVTDRAESAQLIQDAGHEPWRAAHQMSDRITAGIATYEAGHRESESAARAASELDQAVRAGLNPTEKPAQVKPAETLDQGAQNRLHERLGGKDRASTLRDY
ncbi:hypothetical protein [Kribbella sp. NPDC004875]|uniref:hypothetical protein n=1 Tax=Kribbella sp. NPDC004875 TaxID=3364107 RepID=UPI0036A62679